MLELLFLLLPVAVAYGWIMGRNSLRQQMMKSKETLSDQYSAGLEFLLSDQEDRAIEHFIDFLQVNASTLETHLTLAKLFRRRGEFDKALKIHEFLIEQDLDKKEKEIIQVELAKDYETAGLIGRAEETLMALFKSDISTSTTERKQAAISLLNLYHQTREWDKSVAVFTDSVKLEPTMRTIVSNHCCELSVKAEAGKEKKKWLKKALSYDDHCLRALLLLGDFHLEQSNYGNARKFYLAALESDPEFSAILIDPIEKSFQLDNKDDQFYAFLQEQVSFHHCVSFSLKYSEYLEKYEGYERALDYILQALEREPSIRAFMRLLDLEARSADSQASARQFSRVRHIVRNYLKSKLLFECRTCGFAANQHYWLCPSCHNWATVKPARGLDGQ